MENYPFPRTVGSANFTISRRSPVGTFNPDVQSDLVINVDGIHFSLHKFALVSRSGRIRRMVEAAEAELAEGVGENPASAPLQPLLLEFSDFPGGADTFELATKFCYGINFELTAANVAHLRCAAELLEMTETHGGEGNLLARTEIYLREVVMESLDKCAEVLKSCERVMQAAEEVKLVNRCIDAIASQVCREDRVKENIISAFTTSGRGQGTPRAGGGGRASEGVKAVVEWWADTLAPLRVDVFTRLVSAMKCRGIRAESLGGALIHYAERNLLKPLAKRGAYDPKPKVKLTLDGLTSTRAVEHEQRTLLESIVSLLPEKSHVPASCGVGGGNGNGNRNGYSTKSLIFPTKFLLGLLRAAVQLDTTVACRMELERRVACQLERASVSDLLIPAPADVSRPPTLFDVDVVQRVVEAYLQQQCNSGCGQVADEASATSYESEDLRGSGGSPNREAAVAGGGVGRVAKLVDGYLAEIASDANLKAAKFVGLAELVPEHARVSDDALYRAIDIYLKAHPMLPDVERKKLCKLLDCQKLSQEACAHAAQNERLPVQMVVQVLYFEQMRMRNAMVTTTPNDHNNHQQQPQGYQQQLLYSLSSNSSMFNTSKPPLLPAPPIQPQNSIINNIDPYSSLRRDNRELKLEVARLRLQVNDLEQENSTLKHNLEQLHNSNSRVPQSTPSFLSFLSRRFGRFNSLFSTSSPSYRSTSKEASNSDTANSKTIPRRRRHSIS